MCRFGSLFPDLAQEAVRADWCGWREAEKPLSLQGGDLAVRIPVTFLSLCVVFCVASFCPHSDPLREVAVFPILPMRKQAGGREAFATPPAFCGVGLCHSPRFRVFCDRDFLTLSAASSRPLAAFQLLINPTHTPTELLEE